MIGVFLDWLLGPRCHACRTRVFPADTNTHYTACPGVVRR
ncbi:hypothetical protein NPS01_25200 [Nocardioides psychrotolerans]|uniref:Uncharacterized protein n=1 Tax=Nocardioides psychrotolerans TaxID=1005945 RepID=A0A1I3LLS3_9ACTN|nr:hypothetical protein NPS01_25200 [Nocardioides psychrotolerans]SFI85657.1 hypothetical protein SAMN05216561_11422 [Nocardioides psychrotolerans]